MTWEMREDGSQMHVKLDHSTKLSRFVIAVLETLSIVFVGSSLLGT